MPYFSAASLLRQVARRPYPLAAVRSWSIGIWIPQRRAAWIARG